MTRAEQENDQRMLQHNLRVLQKIEEEYQRNPDKPEFALLRSRDAELRKSMRPLPDNWHLDASEKINNGVAAGVLTPDALLYFSSDPLHVLEQMSKSTRDQLDLPDPKQAAEAMVKSFQNSGKLW